MTPERSTTLTTLALASALALAGCATGGNEESTAPATEAPTATSSATGSASASGEPIAAEHNEADVMFAQMMIPHHEQAVQMSEILLAGEDVPAEVRDFAQRVIDAQGPEIERMNAMLAAWGQDASDIENMGHGMSGMMTEEDLQQLETAQGTEAARLYLEQMTAHHEGAVEMARDQVADGQNPQAVALAEDVVAAQEAEIDEMEQMLQELPDGS
ncbi:hypothetical protein AS188_03340 [Kocuria flava]|uniref:DUF305 domain-containing protein n=1 Tax=Kocuria flava TaxID=446860 RepID=A0A0U3G1S9_9MICC|nr:DUF305 domain-containing protein [Kocuria flava]ALU38938.1 hypothetical protein AS188_03340 [Kocuria flava]GEO91141.1 DUF305 domain-containing protein [Kocuria flava]